VMEGNLVRPAGSKPCESGADGEGSPEELAEGHADGQNQPPAGLVKRVEQKVKGIFTK